MNNNKANIKYPPLPVYTEDAQVSICPKPKPPKGQIWYKIEEYKNCEKLSHSIPSNTSSKNIIITN